MLSHTKIVFWAAWLAFFAMPVYADDYAPNASADIQAKESGDDLSQINNNLYQLGIYLGYNLTSPGPTPAVDTLLYSSSSTNPEIIYEQAAVIALFRAMPVNSITSLLESFVPTESGNSASSTLNDQANYTFSNYSSPSQSTPSVLQGIDQEPYQTNPVTQITLDFLTTNDNSICTALAPSSTPYLISTSGCLSQTTIFETALGALNTNSTTSSSNTAAGQIPSVTQFGTYSYVEGSLPQLNAGMLLAPLMYTSSTSSTGTGTSSSTPTSAAQTSQIEQANLLVRYLVGLPPGLASQTEYQALYTQAFPNGTGDITANQTSSTVGAQNTLANYLIQLKQYAARQSIIADNLYYSYSKRVQQNPSSGSTAQPTSQALSEYNMAAWRLYDVQNSSSTQWIDQINTASAATVLKEIAVLLAENNYQMYLSRQLQERQLITTTIQMAFATAGQVPQIASSTNGPNQ